MDRYEREMFKISRINNVFKNIYVSGIDGAEK